MRTDGGETQFADWLLRLGKGSLSTPSGMAEGTIEIPERCVIESPVEDFVFGDKIDISAVKGNIR